MRRLVQTLLLVALLAGIALAQWDTVYTELQDHFAPGDLLILQDVSDSTHSAEGTTKYMQAFNIYKADVVHDTDGHTFVESDNGKLYTNLGATATATYTLLECTAALEGWNIGLQALTAQELRLDPHANDSHASFSDGEAGEYISNAGTKGNIVKVVCMQETTSGTETDAYNWMSSGYLGTWSQQD